MVIIGIVVVVYMVIIGLSCLTKYMLRKCLLQLPRMFHLSTLLYLVFV